MHNGPKQDLWATKKEPAKISIAGMDVTHTKYVLWY